MTAPLKSLLFVTLLAATTMLSAACNDQAAETSTYDGTVGDGLIDFVDTIDALADILADIESVDDCAEAKDPLNYQVDRLRELQGVVGSLSVQSWAQVPRSLDERRRGAIRRFNAEAVRVMMDRKRGILLRDVIVDVPGLIYPELQG